MYSALWIAKTGLDAANLLSFKSTSVGARLKMGFETPQFLHLFQTGLSAEFYTAGNVFAGEVLLASMTSLVPYVVPIPFYLMEVLVGFIQALIFAMLTLVYFTIASHDHDDHDEEHDGEEKKESKKKEAKKEENSQAPELVGAS